MDSFSCNTHSKFKLQDIDDFKLQDENRLTISD